MKHANEWPDTMADPKKLPAWVNEGRKWMRKEMGKPCPSYAPGCVSCEAWLAFTQLESYCEE